MTNEASIDLNPDYLVTDKLGERLRLAREAKQLSLEEVADRLHLSRQRIIDMENDQYKYTSAMTYAKGYLRSYARLLGLSADEVITQFMQQNLGSDIESTAPNLIETMQASAADRSMKWVTFAIVAVLVILVGLWWRSHSQHSASNDSNAVAEQVEVSDAPVETTTRHFSQTSEGSVPLTVQHR